MGIVGTTRTWLVAACAVTLVPCTALAQAKSPQPSSCQAGFDRLRSVHASLTSPEIYPRIAASLATYERELLARLDKDWADKVRQAKRPSDDPALLASAAEGRDEIAALHRMNRGEQYKESARFFVARNELDACLLRARQASMMGVAQQAGATETRKPAPSGPLDQAALDRLSWDELTGVYQRVISAPKADLEYARRIVQTALRRFPDHPNASSARGALTLIETQLSASRPLPTPPPVPPQRAAPPEAGGIEKRLSETRSPFSPPATPQRAAPPEASGAGPLIDQAYLDGMTAEELFVLLKLAGQKFQHAVAGKTSWDGSLRTEELSADDRSTLVTIVPLMKAIFRSMVARFRQNQRAAEWTANIDFFAAIERDLGRIKSGVTLASRPGQSVLDRLPPDELSALFLEHRAKNYADEASREVDMQIVRLVLHTVIARYPDHPFAGLARDALAADEAERKHRVAEIAALLPPAASTAPALPASAASLAPAATPASPQPAPAPTAEPVVGEPTFVERILQLVLGWLGLEVRPTGS